MHYVIAATIILFIVLIGLISFIIIKPYLTELNRIRYMEAKNEEYRLFTDISPELITKSLDEYFEEYVKRYIVYRFVSNKIMYINKEETELMVKNITKNIALDISELYIFYIKTIHAINSDDDLIRFINDKVKNICVEEIMQFNSTVQ